MRKILKILLFSFILCSNVIYSFSQDPVFSQFYANQLYLAPSFAGSSGESRIAINYRNQWPAISNIYNTYSFSYDTYFPNVNSGFGILSTYDVAGSGDLSTTNIGLLYSYDFKITDKWNLRPGINFKFTYTGLNIHKLLFGSQITSGAPPVVIPPYDNVFDIDFAASLITYNDDIWGGVTVDHILKPSQSFYEQEGGKLPIKINIFGGAQFFKKSRTISHKPYIDNFAVAFNFYTQADFYQTDIGAYYNTNIFVIGMWYRGIPFLTSQPGDALIGLFGIKTKNVQIGYSYDFTISSLGFSTSGTHELSLIYKFSQIKNNYNRKIKALPCPEF
jgi:type IX secretion system PorP/SprF family membrane protein